MFQSCPDLTIPVMCLFYFFDFLMKACETFGRWDTHRHHRRVLKLRHFARKRNYSERHARAYVPCSSVFPTWCRFSPSIKSRSAVVFFFPSTSFRRHLDHSHFPISPFPPFSPLSAKRTPKGTKEVTRERNKKILRRKNRVSRPACQEMTRQRVI